MKKNIKSNKTLKTITYMGLTLLVAAGVFAIYYPGLFGPFFLDDLQSIEPAKMSQFSWRELFQLSLQNNTGPLGRPISTASFVLNDYFFGAAPFSYKVVNLCLHLCMGVALGLFIYLLMLLQPKMKAHALMIALMVSLIWLVHPLNVSTVLYPVQRMTQLCHLFTLMGLNTYLVGRLRLMTHQKHALAWMSTSFIFYPLACLSKETAILYPLYLFCIEYFLLRFHSPSTQLTTHLKNFHRFFSLLIILGALCYYWYKLPIFLATFAEKNMSILDRVLTQTKAICLYIQMIFLPSLAKMGLYHDDFPLSTSVDLLVFICSTVLIGCFILIFTLRRKAPIVAFGLSWFFISHLIESTVLPLELVFEHRNYLASIGLLIIPIYYFYRWLKKSSPFFKKTCAFLFLMITLLFMQLTFSRSLSWSSAESFLLQEHLFHPNSPRVHIEIANWFLNQQMYEFALAELDEAQRLQPYNAGIALHKILIFCRAKEVPNALYDNAKRKITQGAISPYTILVLDQMVQNIFNNECDAINKDKIIAIIQRAYDNPFLSYKPLYKAVLLHLEAGLALKKHQIDKSRILLLKSYEVYPKRLDPLIQKAYIELQQGMYQQAKKTADLIHANKHTIYTPYEKVNKLDQLIVKTKDNNRKTLQE